MKWVRFWLNFVINYPNWLTLIILIHTIQISETIERTSWFQKTYSTEALLIAVEARVTNGSRKNNLSLIWQYNFNYPGIILYGLSSVRIINSPQHTDGYQPLGDQMLKLCPLDTRGSWVFFVDVDCKLRESNSVVRKVVLQRASNTKCTLMVVWMHAQTDTWATVDVRSYYHTLFK